MKTPDIINITMSGIEDILKSAEKSISIKKSDKISISILNYKINVLTVYTIAQQVLTVIKSNDLETAKLGCHYLRGKLKEIREGFSDEYFLSVTNKLEEMLIGSKSPIMQEVKARGGTHYEI